MALRMIPIGKAIAACTATLCMSSAGVHAQGLVDPTRPPAASANAMAVDQGGEADPGGLVLQSVMLSPTRKAAIISGQTVELGGKIADSTLVQIAEHEVTLKSSTGTQTLRMYPGVEKKSTVRETKAAPPAKAVRRTARPANSGGGQR